MIMISGVEIAKSHIENRYIARVETEGDYLYLPPSTAYELAEADILVYVMDEGDIDVDEESDDINGLDTLHVFTYRAAN